MLKKIIVVYLVLVASFGYGQNAILDYAGIWEGKPMNTNDLNFTPATDESIIKGFVRFEKNLYPAKLYKKGKVYIGHWNLSMLHYLQPDGLILNMQELTDDAYDVYPILGTFWVADFKQEDNMISFKDYKSGLGFKGYLNTSEILLDLYLGSSKITTVAYEKSKGKGNTEPILSKRAVIKDGWKISEEVLKLSAMEEDLQNGTLVGTEGVVIAKKGEIVYERYFNGFNATMVHDMRSASKSISSAVIGIAIQEGIIENVEQEIYEYLPEEFQYTRDTRKAQIRVKDLLTMSSGLYIFEEDYQESGNWLKAALEAPMKYSPGRYTDYQSVDPFLLGVYLNERLDIPMESYVDNKLFAPLGITNYVFNTDDTGITPYFGGGLYLTPRDMLKFGQLYLNQGQWNGKQLIAKEWITESFKKHTRLQDVRDKNEYGYFWWHDTYTVNGSAINAIEARGAGGQFIFVIPQLETVVVITSGNFRNGKGNQCRDMLRDYILPVMLN